MTMIDDESVPFRATGPFEPEPPTQGVSSLGVLNRLRWLPVIGVFAVAVGLVYLAVAETDETVQGDAPPNEVAAPEQESQRGALAEAVDEVGRTGSSKTADQGDRPRASLPESASDGLGGGLILPELSTDLDLDPDESDPESDPEAASSSTTATGGSTEQTTATADSPPAPEPVASSIGSPAPTVRARTATTATTTTTTTTTAAAARVATSSTVEVLSSAVITGGVDIAGTNTGATGLSIRLYADQNGDGVGETRVRNSTTSSVGRFYWSVDPGCYDVELIPAAGQLVLGGTNRYTRCLGSGQRWSDIGFVVSRPSTPSPQSCTITGEERSEAGVDVRLNGGLRAVSYRFVDSSGRIVASTSDLPRQPDVHSNGQSLRWSGSANGFDALSVRSVAAEHPQGVTSSLVRCSIEDD